MQFIRINYIIGTPSAETINGTNSPDYILGAGGNDLISGNGGNDLIVGSFGSNDTLYGGQGADIFRLYTSNSVSLYPDGRNGFYNNQPYAQDNTNRNVFILPDFSTSDYDGISWYNTSRSLPLFVQVFGIDGSLRDQQFIAFGNTTPHYYRQQHNPRSSASIIPNDLIDYGNTIPDLPFDVNWIYSDYLTT